jgi:hypothetical protein
MTPADASRETTPRVDAQSREGVIQNDSKRPVHREDRG